MCSMSSRGAEAMGANPYLTDAERSILEHAVVGIAGAGGLGSNCALHLVRAGVRRFVICDFDVVSAANLNRQFYFRDQIGQKKIVALAANLRRIEPDLDLDLRDIRVDAAHAADVFRTCDIVVEAFDTTDAKMALLGALLPRERTIVAASGIAGWGRSGNLIVRRIGRNLVMVGDGERGIAPDCPPQAPRVALAAALQANAVVSELLGCEL